MYRARYARPTDDPRLELCTTEHRGPLPPGWLAPGFVANLVVDGEADLHSRGTTHRVARGHVVLSDAGEFRRVTRRYTTTAITRSFICDASLLSEAIRDRDSSVASPHFTRSTTTDPRLLLALETLYAAVDSAAPRLTLDARTEAVFDALGGALGLPLLARVAPHPGVRRARDLIEDRVADDLTLGELVAEVGLSRSHFIRAFTHEIGVTPHQYLLHARVRRARALLARGTPAATAAASVGFCDQSHLTRHFSRLMGVGPSAYRRAVALRRNARGSE